ncbi:MAG: ABC transporter permease [Bacillota bacterium]|nr:ABC transporter permease [Bacillota bacterium]MDW7676153.1 ABC transporter permease [Bacillota bacterium]
MRLSPLNRRLFRMMLSIKGQVISIIVVMTLALMALISSQMTAVNLETSLREYYDITRMADMQVQLIRIPANALYDVERMEGIAHVQGRINVDVPFITDDPDEKVRVKLLSVPDREDAISALYPISGQMVRAETAAVTVIEQFANARNISIGDIVTPYINGREVNLEVIGVAGHPEFVYLMEDEQSILPDDNAYGVLFLSENLMGPLLGYRDSYNELVITLTPGANANDVVDALEEALDRYGVQRVLKRDDIMSYKLMEEELNQVSAMARVLPTLFMSVAALIIYIVLSRTVKNDKMSIGIMKSLGYSNRQILAHYIQFSLIIGLLGGLLGILAGTWISGFYVQLYVQYMNIPLLRTRIIPESYLLALVITLVFCVVAGLAGARRVIGIHPADAMRPEPPAAGHRLLIERVTFLWKRIAFSWKMVIRNIFRNKRRYATLALGIALTYGVTLVAMNMGGVWDHLFDEQYGKMYTMDYNVDFNRMTSHNAISEIRQLAGVEAVEPRLELPLEVRNDWHRKSLSVVGIPKDSQMYHLESQPGVPLNLQHNRLYLTSGVAKVLEVEPGDRVLVKNYLPDRDDFWIEYGGEVNQYLGMNGYMTLETMERTVADPGHITGLSVKTRADLTNILEDAHNVQQVQSLTQMRELFEEYSEMIVVTIGIMVMLGGIIGFAIVYNITLISINERVMEFSSLRVLGFHRKEIFRMITRENAIMSIIGIVLGIPLGRWMMASMMDAMSTEVYSMPGTVSNKVVMQTALAVVIFVTVAQLATFVKIRNLSFIEALKNRMT